MREFEKSKGFKVGSIVRVKDRKGEVVKKGESHGDDPYVVYSVKFNDNETRNYPVELLD